MKLEDYKLAIVGFCLICCALFFGITVSFMLAIMILHEPVSLGFWVAGVCCIIFLILSLELSVKWSKDF